MSLFEEYKWRGMVYDSTPEIEEVLANQKITAYIGFDPSASSLHVGSLLPVMALARLQHYGHTPIAIVGGGTGLIGDPSGKSQERSLLTKEQVSANLQGIKEQLSRFLDFEAKSNAAMIIDNADWLLPFSLIDFLRDIGKYIRANELLRRESVQMRMDLEQGISLTEFCYGPLQAYDYLWLYDHHNCVLQMGGSDQWGNIIEGGSLIKRARGKDVHALVFPLVTNTTGKKFGKTEAGNVWLDSRLTSSFRFYQFWLNTTDQDVIQYLKFFTFLSKEEIEGLDEMVKTSPEKREAQIRLAREVTRMVHGYTELDRAERASSILFGEEIAGLSAQEIADIFQDVPSSSVSKSQLSGEGISLTDLVVSIGLASSTSDARRLIEGGGIYINNRSIPDAKQAIDITYTIEGHFLVVRKGRKEYHLLNILD